MTELVEIFHAKGQARDQRAGDPAAFVRLAYIAKSAIDRSLGPGNRHSADLVELCDALEYGDDTAMPAPPGPLTERYRHASYILQAAARERMLGR